MLDIDIALIPQYYPRSKRESARLPMTCALGHLLGTYPQRFHPNPSISQAAREWPRASAAASPMGAQGTPRAVALCWPPVLVAPARLQ